MAFPKTKIKFNNSDESVAFKAVIKYIFENYTPDKDEEYIVKKIRNLSKTKTKSR